MDNYYAAETSTHASFSERLGTFILALTVFLLPIFILPSQFVAIEVSKLFLLSFGLVLALILFIITSVKHGEFDFPKHKSMLAVLILPGVFILSSLANGNTGLSLFGRSIDVGSTAVVLLGFLAFFLIATHLGTKTKIYRAYLGLALGFIVVLLISLGKFFFGADFLSLSVMTGASSNTLGVWTDLAIFLGVGVILNVMTLELAPLGGVRRTLLWVVLVLSLFVLSALNFTTIWLLLLIFALIFFIFIVSTQGKVREDGRHERRISYSALLTIIVSIIFFFNPVVSDGLKLGEKVASRFGVSNIEVRPAFSTTLNIIKSTLRTEPILGTGPATFDTAWLKDKPSEINLSDYWGLVFTTGFGLLPTFVVTTGLLGALAWLFFLFFYIKLGLRALFTPIGDKESKFFLVSSFLASLFLWIMAIIFTPKITIFALTFVMSGIFMASSLQAGLVGRGKITFGHSAKLSFVSVLLMIIVLLGGISFLYYSTRSSLAYIHFQKASALVGGGKVDEALVELKKSTDLLPDDFYYKSLAEAHIAKLNSILAENNPDESKAESFREHLRLSLEAAQKAIDIDPTHYQNWIVRGQIYESLIPAPLAVEGAYENAKASYEGALIANPHNPEIYLMLARLEVSKNDLRSARTYITKALEEKNNYAEAYFLLTQLELRENNLAQAIRSAEALVLLSPNNPGVYFQLGLLKYNNSNFAGARDAFLEAVRLVPDYANAKYFLGLSYSRLGRRDDAIKEFQDLRVTNPNNAEVSLILSNLEKNLDPFRGFPPGSIAPSTRSELPVRE